MTKLSTSVVALASATIAFTYHAHAVPKGGGFGSCLAHCGTIKDPQSAHECKQYCVDVFIPRAANAPSVRRNTKNTTVMPTGASGLRR